MEEIIYKNINLTILWSTVSYLWTYNIKRSKNPLLLNRLENEKPLDDIVHRYTPQFFYTGKVHRVCDLCAVVFPLYIIFLNYKNLFIFQLLFELGIFHVYKQLVCMSTRFPPAKQAITINRSFCGFTTGIPIDYGISGHTSLPVLLFLHTNSNLALSNAIFQSILSIVTKDHYTIDVMHTWIFLLSIFNRMEFLY